MYCPKSERDRETDGICGNLILKNYIYADGMFFFEHW